MKDDLKDGTFQFATRVVKLCRMLDDTPGVARTLAKQLLRSGTSIGANVEEGQGSQGNFGRCLARMVLFIRHCLLPGATDVGAVNHLIANNE